MDQLCKCGARFGDHGAPAPRCPNGEEFRSNSYFDPTPGRRTRPYDQRDMLRDAAKAGVQPVWRAEHALGDDGKESIQGWTIANKPEVEAAARRWRQYVKEHGDPHNQPEVLMALLGGIGEGGER